jgi:hypothetical protein
MLLNFIQIQFFYSRGKPRGIKPYRLRLIKANRAGFPGGKRAQGAVLFACGKRARDRAEILFCPPGAGKKDWSDSPVLAASGKDAPRSSRIR